MTRRFENLLTGNNHENRKHSRQSQEKLRIKFKKIQQKNPDINLKTSSYRVFPYGADKPIELLGQFTAEIKSDTITKTDKFLVTKTNSKCLLSYKTCTALELLDVKVNANGDHANLSQIQRNVQRNGQHEKDTSDVDIDPFALRPYRIPHSMKTAVNSKLEEMRKQGIIEKVNGSIPWLSLIMVISKKGGDIRLVLDMRVPNQALTRRGLQYQQWVRSCRKWRAQQFSMK